MISLKPPLQRPPPSSASPGPIKSRGKGGAWGTMFMGFQRPDQDPKWLMNVLAHRSSHRDTMLDTTCLLCGAQPEMAPHLWACSAHSHEWGPARRRLAAWLDQKVGTRAAPVRHQLWEPTVLE